MEDIQKLRSLLFEFVERAVKEDADPEDKEALPKIAQILLDSFGY